MPVTGNNSQSAQVLMFTGIRRERLLLAQEPQAQPAKQPMFVDTVPTKPKGRGRGRRKNA